jgi:hypothetical protein
MERFVIYFVKNLCYILKILFYNFLEKFTFSLENGTKNIESLSNLFETK